MSSTTNSRSEKVSPVCRSVTSLASAARSRGECYRRDIGLSDRQIRASGLKDAADPQIELPGCGRCGGQTEIKAPVEIFALLLEVEWRPWIQPKRVDSGEKGI